MNLKKSIASLTLLSAASLLSLIPTPVAHAGTTITEGIAITDADRGILSAAANGGDVSELFQRSTIECNIHQKTNKRNSNSSFEMDVCNQSAPATGVLVYGSAKLFITDNSNCSYNGPKAVGGGANIRLQNEVDRVYGRAIELAAGKGDIEAKLRLEAMRDKASQLVAASSATDSVYSHISAVGGGWSFGYHGFCVGKQTVDVIQILPKELQAPRPRGGWPFGRSSTPQE